MVRGLCSCRISHRKKSGMMKTRTGFTHGFRDPRGIYTYIYIYIWIVLEKLCLGGFKSRDSEVSLLCSIPEMAN